MAHGPEGYDYSQLIGSPASESDKEFDTARFDELLNDDDRLLLYDMQISWQTQTDAPR